LIDWIREDAEALGCLAEVEHAREIVARGSSACRQTDVYENARTAGLRKRDAFNAVVDMLVEETQMGLQTQAS
jgi:carboxylate-amine ligase